MSLDIIYLFPPDVYAKEKSTLKRHVVVPESVARSNVDDMYLFNVTTVHT